MSVINIKIVATLLSGVIMTRKGNNIKQMPKRLTASPDLHENFGTHTFTTAEWAIGMSTTNQTAHNYKYNRERKVRSYINWLKGMNMMNIKVMGLGSKII